MFRGGSVTRVCLLKLPPKQSKEFELKGPPPKRLISHDSTMAVSKEIKRKQRETKRKQNETRGNKRKSKGQEKET